MIQSTDTVEVLHKAFILFNDAKVKEDGENLNKSEGDESLLNYRLICKRPFYHSQP